jgi:uncharacterized membrane protein
MEYLFIYGLQVADILENIAIFTAILLGVFLFLVPFIIFLLSLDQEEIREWWNLWIKKILIFLIVTPLILFLLPTKQTMLLIGGTYLGKKAVNQVVTSDKMEKINTIIDLQLDRYIKELKAGNNDR